MINHARTLLLNSTPLAGRCAEYVPPTYKPKKLSPALRHVWDVLYGEDITDEARNYRTQQLMAILHSTELAKYVLELDPRITYLPITPDLEEPPGELIPFDVILDELEEVIEQDGRALFTEGVHPHMEVFESTWYEHKQFAYKLSAVVLALIYMIGESDEVEEH